MGQVDVCDDKNTQDRKQQTTKYNILWKIEVRKSTAEKKMIQEKMIL
ncbi:hypothetical protein, unlikely [Trypanosoma brucei brucei TREU927]|uniref:Uncharacterized protein n=1 Tax=Trypanosoma brucei brucei (strain 927/4 GUTat10.1) TaxID=185431 RepID=Q38CN0_TRYB2|nr:hypothetical protein, unlikely [Trypanosoma brucei brucei TREU927]EAN77440.1 hypothetical protein, unlikely [Trypanosoma brucei brucei TREU927]